MRFLLGLLGTLLVFGAIHSAAAQPAETGGPLLADYLEALNRQGLRIIYSSDLVGSELRLAAEPAAGDPRATLDDVLRPFGLAAVPGPSGSLLVIQQAEEQPAPAVRPDEALPETPIPEIVVTSSLHRLEYSEPATHTYLDRDLAIRIPLVADEAVRLTNRLPGTASGGVSSRSHVRGGEINEVLFLFDGLRLYEPYHLKDFQAITTIINSNAIGGMDFYTGAYPARYGDRMSGVLEIGLREPVAPIQTEIALSFFNASLLSMGQFGDERQGEWLISARRGNLDLIVDVVDPDFGSPHYQDYLAHVAWEFGPRARLSANFLLSDDKLSLNDVDRGEEARGSYANEVFWFKWQADWSESLQSDTIVAISDFTDRRSGNLDLPGIVTGTLDDTGEFRAAEFRQDWRWIASDKWMLRFGVNLKDLDASYRFSSAKFVAAPFDTILDNQAVTIRDFDLSAAGAQYAAYTELRWQPTARWTADFGLRWDQQNYTTASDDKQYSPRASILYRPGAKTEIRFGWGQYYQAQEVNELQVSDGVTEFFAAQRAEHFVANLKHTFSSGLDLGLTIYRKSFRTIQPRFENSFNSLTLLPELQFDRIRVDASRAEALGAELLLTRSYANRGMLWWLGYAWSRVEDEIGAGKVPRSWDQTHTVKAGLSWQWASWDFSVAGEAHTGWPITTLSGTMTAAAGGTQDLRLEVSPRNTDRFQAFHTLDARISRTFDVSRGDLTAFFEVTNLYDRANPCCTEYSLNPDGSLAGRETHWLPLVPSLGVVWQF
jgi:outer membrane receptor protein involved in Fe transport